MNIILSYYLQFLNISSSYLKIIVIFLILTILKIISKYYFTKESLQFNKSVDKALTFSYIKHFLHLPLPYLEKATSGRTLKHIEKQFVVDNGFLLACNDSNKIFVAHALENIVYNELLYRGYDVKIGKTYKGEIDFVAMKDGKKCFIQVAYLLSSDDVIEREFGAFDSIRDPSPKYVFSLDEYDMSKDGITHFNIEDWLLYKVDVTLS